MNKVIFFLLLSLPLAVFGSSFISTPLSHGLEPNDKYSPVDLDSVTYASPHGFVLSGSVWFQDQIPVCWQEYSESSATHRSWVKNAVNGSWAANSGVTFTGWGECATTSQGIRIKVEDVKEHGPRTRGGLGRNLDGRNNGMSLNFTFANWGRSCAYQRQECIESFAVHEFGHALGFAHEQNRDDTPGSCDEDPQGTPGDVTVGAWDLDSVMNYCNPAYSGDRELSATDITMVNLFYPLNRPEREVTITRYYTQLLHRTPDQAGWDFYMNSLNYWGCNANTLGAIFEQLVDSDEFDDSMEWWIATWRTTELINRIFYAALGREPDEAGRDYYFGELASGRKTQADFVSEVVGSSEFASNASSWCAQ